MMKKMSIFTGVAGLSLIALPLAAAAAQPASVNPPQSEPAQVVGEEQSITIVAIPCSSAGDSKCVDKCKDTPAKEKSDKCKTPTGCEKQKEKCCPMGEKDYCDEDYGFAYALLELTDIPESLGEANTYSIAAQMQQRPDLRPAHAAFKEFFDRHCSYEALKKDLAKIHLATFTREEMKKLIDFFKSPVGRKFSANQTELMKKSIELREKRIRENLPELHKNVHKILGNSAQKNAGSAGQK